MHKDASNDSTVSYFTCRTSGKPNDRNKCAFLTLRHNAQKCTIRTDLGNDWPLGEVECVFYFVINGAETGAEKTQVKTMCG